MNRRAALKRLAKGMAVWLVGMLALWGCSQGLGWMMCCAYFVPVPCLVGPFMTVNGLFALARTFPAQPETEPEPEPETEPVASIDLVMHAVSTSKSEPKPQLKPPEPTRQLEL